MCQKDVRINAENLGGHNFKHHKVCPSHLRRVEVDDTSFTQDAPRMVLMTRILLEQKYFD
ncbi:hypothetical protein CHS0354_021840 [Potamilus streckersoni]|uniref:Uncharacterized protein n=1 Tax=Potamilus streckersoni TaxID=2493646 RepID=A0AAE0RQK9_9BIVA|nr:hypothetical protein CHS0354_021840 [Potamilus streckersoni]